MKSVASFVVVVVVVGVHKMAEGVLASAAGGGHRLGAWERLLLLL